MVTWSLVADVAVGRCAALGSDAVDNITHCVVFLSSLGLFSSSGQLVQMLSVIAK